jgi:hypothetical protein
MGRGNSRAALQGGGRGLFLGKLPSIGDDIVRTSRRRAVAHFYPSVILFLRGRRKNIDDKDVNCIAE